MTLCATEKGKVYLTTTHHSDLTWKWGYDEYSQIRARQFLQISEWFEKYPDYHFHVEQAETLKVFFDEYPEKLPIFRQAYNEGRFTLTGGNSISDVNFCYGETLVRNIQRGKKYYSDVFDCNVTIANLDDDFGMCFQIPQILKLAGYRFLIPGRLPNSPENIDKNEPFVWQGENDSEIVVLRDMYGFDAGSKKQSLPLSHSFEDCSYQSLINIRDSQRNGDILALYNDETGLFSEDIFKVMTDVNQTEGNYHVAFGSVADYAESITVSELEHYKGEFNPTYTGCYTTRIGIKQDIRKAENLLYAAEMLAAGENIKVDLDNAWHQLELASFHDAACGCHHDQANKEIVRKLKSAQSAASNVLRRAMPAGCNIFNPAKSSGVRLVEIKSKADFVLEDCPVQRSGSKLFCTPWLAGFGITPVKVEKTKLLVPEKAGMEFSTAFFEVDFSTPYPVIKPHGLKNNPFGTEYFGELCFRFDRGSMWVESFTHHYYGRECQHEEVVSIVKGPVFYEVVTEGRVLGSKPANDGSKYDYWDAFRKLTFRKTWRFYHDLDYFSLDVDVDWRGNATKIYMSFPTGLDVVNSRALFDVPFGTIERKPYFEVPKKYESTFCGLSDSSYDTARGDWPALHWVDYADNNCGLTMANSGTPGHQLVGGNILVSLIRSGTVTVDGNLKPQRGSFDNGKHKFEFAFRAHDRNDSNPGALGEALNRKPVFRRNKGKTEHEEGRSFLYDIPDNISIVSLRDNGDGMIIRACEIYGKSERLRYGILFRFGNKEYI